MQIFLACVFLEKPFVFAPTNSIKRTCFTVISCKSLRTSTAVPSNLIMACRSVSAGGAAALVDFSEWPREYKQTDIKKKPYIKRLKYMQIATITRLIYMQIGIITPLKYRQSGIITPLIFYFNIFIVARPLSYTIVFHPGAQWLDTRLCWSTTIVWVFTQSLKAS